MSDVSMEQRIWDMLIEHVRAQGDQLTLGLLMALSVATRTMGPVAAKWGAGPAPVSTPRPAPAPTPVPTSAPRAKRRSRATQVELPEPRNATGYMDRYPGGKEKSAWQLGRLAEHAALDRVAPDAKDNGEQFGDNPFPLSSPEARAWSRGRAGLLISHSEEEAT